MLTFMQTTSNKAFIFQMQKCDFFQQENYMLFYQHQTRYILGKDIWYIIHHMILNIHEVFTKYSSKADSYWKYWICINTY